MLSLDWKQFSGIGKRKNNEDALGVFTYGQQTLFAAADGLGGHGSGEIASHLAVAIAKETFEKAGLLQETIPKIFEKTQERLLALQKEAGDTGAYKTTLVLGVVCDYTLSFAHIGDSRLYLFRNGRVFTRTYDHSVPQALVFEGKIKEKDIRRHPQQNQLLRVLGSPWRDKSFELGEKVLLMQGDALLLCTDGFWEYITEEKMQLALRFTGTAKEWADLMIRIVEFHGRHKDMDNYSCIAVRCI